MAKKKYVPKPVSKGVYKYPSQFGSHESMVVVAETERLGDPKLVICEDDYGMYVTERSRLDDGLADNNRFSDLEWRAARLKEVSGQVIDIIIHPEPIIE